MGWIDRAAAKLFRRKQVLAPLQANWLSPLANTTGGWFPVVVREPFTGAWQRNAELRMETVLAFSAVYACVTLIASDVGKLRLRLVEQDANGIWSEVDRNSPYWAVLEIPNSYQNRIKFIEQWVLSKLLSGNTYVLKQRDQRGIVTAMHVLDPYRTKVLQAPNGDIYYELSQDDLADVTIDDTGKVAVPTTEIIHDRMSCLYHPLVGISPISACNVAAAQALSIQQQSYRFFGNSARPAGILTAPAHIGDDTAARLKAHWQESFSGDRAGQVAVLGDGLKFEPMTMTAVDAQLIEQLKWTAETVASAFHVPAYMIGAAPAPAYNNIEALNAQYYSQCLHSIIENIEICLDQGLGLTSVPERVYGTEFDVVEGLLRMDTATLFDTLGKGVGASIVTPNEARRRIDLKPLKGGDTVYMQQQNYSLAALDARDRLNPLAPQPQPQPQLPGPSPQQAEPSLDDAAAAQYAAWELKSYLAQAA